MFETHEFRAGIAERLQSVVNESQLLHYHHAIPDTLQLLAIANEDVLMNEERFRPVTQRRGVSQAYESVDSLARKAAQLAQQRKSLELEMIDMAHSYAIQFCSVWPFCRTR
jgi:hypothetical protein